MARSAVQRAIPLFAPGRRPTGDQDASSSTIRSPAADVGSGPGYPGTACRDWRRRKIKLAELLNEPWIFPPSGTIPYSLVSEAFRRAGLETPRATVSSLSIPVHVYLLDTARYLAVLPESTIRFSACGFNFPAHRNLRVSEGVENLLR
jgi:hypothetical protein